MTALLTRTTAGHRPEPEPELLDRIYPADRRCPEPGCVTILCTYNPGPRCFLHTQKHLVEAVGERAQAEAA
jgi:hypothetical protein